MKLVHSTIPHTELKRDQRPKCKIRNHKTPKENIGRTFFERNCSSNFLDLSPKAKEIIAHINKWDLIKLESFCPAKTTMKGMATTTNEKANHSMRRMFADDKRS